jgi:hypothetical protein
MMADRSEPDSADRRLRELLLAYLQATTVCAWPGTDGLTVEDVLDGYPQAVAAGEVPNWQQLLHQHPELAAELPDWLAAKDRWQFACRRGQASAQLVAGIEDAVDNPKRGPVEQGDNVTNSLAGEGGRE